MYLENNKEQERLLRKFSVGMRLVKTVIAVFVSLILTVLKNGQPISAAIAALICIERNSNDSIQTGLTRVIGTIIGGIYSLIFLYAIDFFKVELFTLLYYFAMSLLIIPIIKTTILLKIPNTSINAVIVVLITLLSYIVEYNKYSFVIDRVVDTTIGVVVAIIVNMVLPAKKDTDVLTEKKNHIESLKKLLSVEEGKEKEDGDV